ncbi:hypothetical protein V8F33_008518 [Rhypophila sp. PSN 637]
MAYQQPIDQPLPVGSPPPPSYGAAANDNIQPIPVQQQNITYVDEKGQPLPQQPQQQQPQFIPAQQPIQMQQMPVGQPQFIPQPQLQPQQMVIMTPQGPMLVQGAAQGAMVVGPDGKTMTTTTVMATVQPQTMPQQMPQQVTNTTTVIQTKGGSNAGAAAAGAAGGAAGGFCGACCGDLLLFPGRTAVVGASKILECWAGFPLLGAQNVGQLNHSYNMIPTSREECYPFENSMKLPDTGHIEDWPPALYKIRTPAFRPRAREEEHISVTTIITPEAASLAARLLRRGSLQQLAVHDRTKDSYLRLFFNGGCVLVETTVGSMVDDGIDGIDGQFEPVEKGCMKSRRGSNTG